MGAKDCFLFFLLICSTLAFSSDNDWTEVKSPHFTVLGDGPGEQARSVALSFEQARAIFTDALHGMRHRRRECRQSSLPRAIQRSMRALLGVAASQSERPAPVSDPIRLVYERQRSRLFGCRNGLAVVRSSIAIHQYIHKLLRAELYADCPNWLDEGLADFFANFQ